MNRATLIPTAGLVLALASCAPGDPDGSENPPALSRSMNTIASATALLDRQESIAAWYTVYDGDEESILYANPLFAETFGLPVDEILAKRRYHLVNPPGTPAGVIEQYQREDREAIERGHFIHRGPFTEGKDILVLKLRFDRGMLGLFKVVDASASAPAPALVNLDADFRALLARIRPDLLE